MHNLSILIFAGIVFVFVLYQLSLILASRNLVKFLNEIITGNTLARFSGKGKNIFSRVGEKTNEVLSILSAETELTVNKLQDKNILMYQYIKFFLTIPTIYSFEEIMKLALEYSFRIFRVEIVQIITKQDNGHIATIYQSISKKFPRFFSRPLGADINLERWDKGLTKNYFLPEERELIFTDDISITYNLLQIPITVDNKVTAIIQIINKSNRNDFDEYDQEVGKTISMAVANQLKIISIIEEEKVASERLSSIINNISDGIIITDTNQKIIMENPAARDLFSLNPIKKDILINELLKSPSNPNINMVLFKPERVVLLGKISEIFNHKGDIDKYIISFRNITETKQKEREKSEILFLTATKMYTPLLSIKKTKELFKFSNEPEIEEQLSNNINLVFNLMNKLIFYTEIESGPMRLAKKPCNINYIVEKVIDSMGAVFNKNQFKMNMVLDKQIEKNMLDPDRMEQSINTILSFIVKIAGGNLLFKTVDIKTSLLTEEKNLLVQIIHYNYLFDSMELLELTKKSVQLEKFMQSDQKLEDLNLEFAFVNHIAKSHGGTFSIESNNKGTFYNMNLPVE
ncbi:MAG: PAS domain-containing protein [Candidatus Margulisbacteria bacterium]|nr:PAS domain-containing protein [Candidatus Margulisiibacteriota bacterium]